MSTADEERAYWDAQASSEEAAKGAIAADESAWSGEQLELCLAQIIPALNPQPGQCIVDIGCGAGRLTIPLAQRFPLTSWVGIDVSPRLLALALARQVRIEDGLEEDLPLTWYGCDGRSLPFEGWYSRIDAAYSMITFQHIPREGQAAYIRDLGRHLPSGGVFRFQVREGTGAVFMDHRVTEEWMDETAKAVGLKLEAYDRLGAFSDPNEICPWVTLRKP